MSSTQIMSLEALTKQLQSNLQAAKDAAPPPSGAKIRPSKTGFELPNGAEHESLEFIILGHTYINALYEGRYVPGKIESPVCWAINEKYESMVPDESCKKPQNDGCFGCPKNEWGSADGGRGRGKDCKNMVRLALIPPDADVKTPVLYIDLAPTSTGTFNSLLQKSQVPLQTVIVKATLDDKVDFAKIILTPVGRVDASIAPILIQKIEEAKSLLVRGFNYDS